MKYLRDDNEKFLIYYFCCRKQKVRVRIDGVKRTTQNLFTTGAGNYTCAGDFNRLECYGITIVISSVIISYLYLLLMVACKSLMMIPLLRTHKMLICGYVYIPHLRDYPRFDKKGSKRMGYSRRAAWIEDER